MAALSHPYPALNVSRPVPGRPLTIELAIMHAVSGAMAHAPVATVGITKAVQALLALPGILSVELIPDPVARWLVPHPHRWGAGDRVARQPKVSVLAPVSAAGQTWGEVRLGLDLGFLAVASPVCLVRFVGQQFGMLLHHATLTNERSARSRELEGLREELAHRKLVARAATTGPALPRHSG